MEIILGVFLIITITCIWVSSIDNSIGDFIYYNSSDYDSSNLCGLRKHLPKMVSINYLRNKSNLNECSKNVNINLIDGFNWLSKR